MLGGFRTEITPESPLARVQGVWNDVVGERIAAVTEVVDEREGVLTVECSSAVWAQELELMGPRILARLKAEIEDSPPEKLRFRASSGRQP
jgi:predicted nucleic acid-binding Zn ribbon protein